MDERHRSTATHRDAAAAGDGLGLWVDSHRANAIHADHECLAESHTAVPAVGEAQLNALIIRPRDELGNLLGVGRVGNRARVVDVFVGVGAPLPRFQVLLVTLKVDRQLSSCRCACDLPY